MNIIHTHTHTHTHTHIYIYISMAQQSAVGQVLLIIEASRSHSDTPHSVGLFWTSDQPDPVTANTLHPQQTDSHSQGGIRTRNPSKRAATEPRLRPCDHWDRHDIYSIYIYISQTRRITCILFHILLSPWLPYISYHISRGFDGFPAIRIISITDSTTFL